jgi:YD repeat-containing protein
LYVRQKVDVDYIQVATNKHLYGRFNAAIEPLMQSYFEQGGGYMLVLADLRDKVEVFNTLSDASRSYEAPQIAIGSYPILDLVDSEVLSVVQGVVFFRINFHYSLEYTSGRSYGQEFKVSHYYTGDLVTGKINRLIRQPNDSRLDALEQAISVQLNDTYKMITSQLNPVEIALIEGYFDDGEESEDSDSAQSTASRTDFACEDICPRILMHEADWYWLGFGVMLHFPDWSKTSEIFGGRGFCLFLDSELARKTMTGFDEFAFLRRMNVSPAQQRNMNYWDIVEKINQARVVPDILSVMKLNKVTNTPVELTSKSYQDFQDGSSNYRSYTRYRFESGGQISEQITKSPEEQIYQEIYFHYDALGRLTATSEGSGRRDEKTGSAYRYDSKGNLLERTILHEDDLSRFVYFYFSDNIYMLRYSQLGDPKESQVSFIQMGSSEFCIDSYCYLIDSGGKVKGMRSDKQAMYQAQFGYNASHQLIEAHYENDRYNYYFEYDTDGRLVGYMTFEFMSPTIQVEWKYRLNERIPYEQIKISRGGETMERETYSLN